MVTNRCPYCKETINADVLFCEHCGIGLKSNEKNQKRATDSFTLIKNALKNKYDIIGLVGKGGMASVYKAKQKNLDRIIAIKVIHPHLLDDHEFVGRFLQEARIGASLVHPNIASIFDFGEVEGLYYICMEYLDGDDLATIIRQKKRLKPNEALFVVRSIAHALNHIHRKNLIHRDVKSANIIVTGEGRPVLTDFGIAHARNASNLTIAGSLLGTPEFLSPEQVRGREATFESDFYSLGIVFFECLTGCVPFSNPNPLLVINEIINTKPSNPSTLNPDIPYGIERIIMGLLEKRPENRIPFIHALLAEKPFENDFLSLRQEKIDKLNRNNRLGWLRYMSFKKSINPRSKTKILLNATLLMAFLGIVIWIGIMLSTSTGIIRDIISTNDPNKSDETSFISGHAAQESAGIIDSERILTGSNISNLDNTNHYQTKSYVSEIINQIESQMVLSGGVMIMKNHISQRVWKYIMENESSGPDNALVGNSFIQIKSFLNRINLLDENIHVYHLPSLSIIENAIENGIITSRYSEWVSDPPVFRGEELANYAKYYHNGFKSEAGLRNDERRNDISFRLCRYY